MSRHERQNEVGIDMIRNNRIVINVKIQKNEKKGFYSRNKENLTC